MLSFFKKSKESPSTTHRINTLRTYGLPPLSRCLGHDPVQGVVAIGSRRGVVKILGAGDQEVTFTTDPSDDIQQLVFLPNKGFLVIRSGTRKLTLWRWADQPQLVNSVEFKHEDITCIRLPAASNWLLVGTSRGNIHPLHAETFERSRHSIMWNKVSKNGVHPGAIKAIEPHPLDSGKILMLFDTNKCILYDLIDKKVDREFNTPATSTVNCVAWNGDGKSFLTGHDSGHIHSWSIKGDDKLKSLISTPETPYAPVPVTRLQLAGQEDERTLVFDGGFVPVEATANPVSFMFRENKCHLYTKLFDAEVADIALLRTDPWPQSPAGADAVAILFNDELCIFELEAVASSKKPLTADDIRPLPLRHGLQLHRSRLTVMHVARGVPFITVSTLRTAGRLQQSISSGARSAAGSNSKAKKSDDADIRTTDNRLLFTGHENGMVVVWLFNGDSLKTLVTLSEPQDIVAPLIVDDCSVCAISFAVARSLLFVSYNNGLTLIYQVSRKRSDTTSVEVTRVEMLLAADNDRDGGSGSPTKGSKSSSSAGSPSKSAASPVKASSESSPRAGTKKADANITEDMVAPLVQHGFSEKEAREELIRCGGDMNTALSNLYIKDAESKGSSLSASFTVDDATVRELMEKGFSEREVRDEIVRCQGDIGLAAANLTEKQLHRPAPAQKKLVLEDATEQGPKESVIDGDDLGHTDEEKAETVQASANGEATVAKVPAGADQDVVQDLEDAARPVVLDLNRPQLPGLQVIGCVESHAVNLEESLIDQVALMEWNDATELLVVVNHFGLNLVSFSGTSTSAAWNRGISCQEIQKRVAQRNSKVEGKQLVITATSCARLEPELASQLLKEKHDRPTDVVFFGTNRSEVFCISADESSPPVLIGKLKDDATVLGLHCLNSSGTIIRPSVLTRRLKGPSVDTLSQQIEQAASLAELEAVGSRIKALKSGFELTEAELDRLRTAYAARHKALESSSTSAAAPAKAPPASSPPPQEDSSDGTIVTLDSAVAVAVGTTSGVAMLSLVKKGIKETSAGSDSRVFRTDAIRCQGESMLLVTNNDSTVTAFKLPEMQRKMTVNLFIPKKYRVMKVMSYLDDFQLLGVTLNHGLRLAEMVPERKGEGGGPAATSSSASSAAPSTPPAHSLFDHHRKFPPRPTSIGRVISDIFSNTTSPEEREELFDKSVDSRASSAAMDRRTHVDDEQAKSMGQLTRLQQQAQERTERLKKVEERADEMQDNAAAFGDAASQLVEMYKNKKWWQF